MNIEVVQMDGGYQAVILSDGGNVIDRVAPCPTRASAVIAGVQMYPQSFCGCPDDEDEVMSVVLWILLTPNERLRAKRENDILSKSVGWSLLCERLRDTVQAGDLHGQDL